ncbi:MAG: hypothetical protein MJZ37_06755 [Bacilli bacterium]|nr:hypothetical protein [Bacilli bacterium]
MNEIPVTVNITLDDVLLLSDMLESEGVKEINKLAAKLLLSIKKSSEQLSVAIDAVDGANPYCMEKIEI